MKLYSLTADALSGLKRLLEKRAVVLSQGKSGSTALLEGVSQALGINNQLMEPRDLTQVELPRVVVVKKLIERFQDDEAEILSGFQKRIFLVRDPRDALISRTFYAPYKQGVFNSDENVSLFLQAIERKIADPDGVSFRTITDTLQQILGLDVITVMGGLSEKTIQVRDKLGSHFHLCRYEDFVSGQVSGLERYLGAKLPRSIEVRVDVSRVTRTKGAGDWRHWMTGEDAAFFDAQFADFYEAFGYEPGTVYGSPTLSAETSLHYVVRVVNEGRKRQRLPLYEWHRTDCMRP